MTDRTPQTSEKETKSERFRRLAPQRTRKAIKRIQHVGNLAATATYEYTEAEALAIMTALQDAVSKCADAFFPESVSEKPFDLPPAPPAA